MAKVMIFWDVKIQAYQLKMKGDYGKIKGTVDFLKKVIPHSDRDYKELIDPKTGNKEHIWTFVEKYLDGVQKFCIMAWGAQEVACLTRQAVEGQSQQTSTSTVKISGLDAVLLDFMKLLPFEAAQKAYRSASMILHPDHGGNMESMSKLNQAWQRIEKEVYRQ
jgi:hypothetical protein